MRSIRETFIVESNKEKKKKQFWINYYQGNNRPTSVTGLKNRDIRYNSIQCIMKGSDAEEITKTKVIGILCKILKKYVLSEKMYFAYNEGNLNYIYLKCPKTEKEIGETIELYKQNSYPYENIKEHINVFKGGYDLSDVLITWNSEHVVGEYELVFAFEKDRESIKLCFRYDEEIDNDTLKDLLKEYFCELKENKIELSIPESDQIFENEIWSIFKQKAMETKNAIALVEKNKTVTYGELLEKINLFAEFIKKNYIEQKCIAIVSERNVEYVVAMFAILKLNKVFVPIDSKTPEQRQKYIIEQIGGCVILNDYKEYLAGYTQIIYCSDECYVYKMTSWDVPDMDNAATYIIYTSGTTGNPKGVIVGEESIINLNDWYSQKFLRYPLNVLAITSISFDVSIEEIMISLLNGSTVHLVADEIKLDPELFFEYVKLHRINLIQFVPDSLRMLLQTNEKISSLKYVICGGEALDIDTRDRVLQKGYKLYNHYGPTETTVDAITCECTLDQNEKVIGKPISNTEIFVLDKSENEVVDGMYGEIVIAGKCLALGYFNNREKTKESFKYISSIKKVVYKTGDYGRKTFDGNIEFIGRKDSQVKVRGHRIELGEIESIINGHNKVVRAKVDILNSNIIAYVEVTSNTISRKALKSYILRYLPMYMVPQKIIFVKRLPVTINGKIDLKNIAADELEQEKVIDKCKLSVVEKKLLVICEKILCFEINDITEQFEELGVDSFYRVALCCSIQNEICKDIKITDFEKYNSISKLATYIEQLGCDVLKKEKNHEDMNIILLKSNNAAKNVFFVHPGNGEIHMFLNLISHMPDDFNYYGIRFPDRYDVPYNINAEVLAKYYCSEILKIQSDDFIIIGHCIGGTIAYEMGCQIEKMGKRIEYLGLLNTFAPDKEFWGTVKDFSLQTEYEQIKHFIRNKEFISSCKERKLTIVQLWHEVEAYLKKHVEIDVKQSIYDDMDKIIHDFDLRSNVEIVRYINRIRMLDRLRARYIPKDKVTTNIHLLLANQECAANYDKWENFTYANVKIKKIIGTNTTIFKEPNVQILADEIINGIKYADN